MLLAALFIIATHGNTSNVHQQLNGLKKPQCMHTLVLSYALSIQKEQISDTMGEGNGNPAQYSCLENPMDGGAWQAEVHGVAKSQTRLSDFTFTFHFHTLEKEMATHSSVLPGQSQGRWSLVGCRLWGHTESDTTEVT